MSYPVLEATKAFARVEVRSGAGASGWNSMATVYDGECERGQSWAGGEGEKLAARHCLWPNDSGSTMSQPYVVSGTAGLEVGRAERLRFPSGV